jgi:hypothetical protein
MSLYDIMNVRFNMELRTRGYWRVILLSLLSLALIGPWMFDLINVPAEYTCHAPNVRLYGDFCGVPISGFQLLSWMVSGFVTAGLGLVTGSVVFSDWFRQLVFSLLTILVLLPIISMLLMILRGERRRLQVFNLVAWGLALGLCLLIGLSNYPNLYWALWGLWLYNGLAAGGVMLEVVALRQGSPVAGGRI